MISTTATQAASWQVIDAYKPGNPNGYWAQACRVMSGLLQAAAKRGEIVQRTHCGRVTGCSVWYELTESQLAEIQQTAIDRGNRRK